MGTVFLRRKRKYNGIRPRLQAAEQPQADLGSTINALVSATPPNVALTRTDFHHLYHQSEWFKPYFGTFPKINHAVPLMYLINYSCRSNGPQLWYK